MVEDEAGGLTATGLMEAVDTSPEGSTTLTGIPSGRVVRGGGRGTFEEFQEFEVADGAKATPWLVAEATEMLPEETLSTAHSPTKKSESRADALLSDVQDRLRHRGRSLERSTRSAAAAAAGHTRPDGAMSGQISGQVLGANGTTSGATSDRRALLKSEIEQLRAQVQVLRGQVQEVGTELGVRTVL
ncbi:hypothetical protein GNI_176120 [Gregarina niphandrodes]|uniref:Uncharacterized protein n=1 Tax=Gregarina niphandrodes TaxID=110365 RepID=A0A023AYJ5_GRENI|nr:hypothetical protein GNI_176120 [Gregarina niphandrodes]EZG43350.1 hypothetical protein GNI_176120 [Gregarina niphandrodes]|eukprot:XP_011133399.1 hypothetical protein GNI_176120 [Gregarina niphandrodes]